MKANRGLFPYPVLWAGSDTYEQGSFTAHITMHPNGHVINFGFALSLNCEDLAGLIRARKAEFVCHVECPATKYRRITTSNETKGVYVEHSVNRGDISGIVELSTFVVATESITGFTSRDFHADYAGMRFSFSPGCILAIGSAAKVDVAPDSLKHVTSIFAVSGCDDPCMSVDVNSSKIVIKLPRNAFAQYKLLRDNTQARSAVNAGTVLPALIQVLNDLQKLAPEERGEYEDRLWYRCLSNALRTHFALEPESEEFRDRNALVLAQQLIEGGIVEGALTYLTTGILDEGDEADI